RPQGLFAARAGHPQGAEEIRHVRRGQRRRLASLRGAGSAHQRAGRAAETQGVGLRGGADDGTERGAAGEVEGATSCRPDSCAYFFLLNSVISVSFFPAFSVSFSTMSVVSLSVLIVPVSVSSLPPFFIVALSLSPSTLYVPSISSFMSFSFSPTFIFP